jgi:hypothetical protein
MAARRRSSRRVGVKIAMALARWWLVAAGEVFEQLGEGDRGVVLERWPDQLDADG